MRTVKSLALYIWLFATIDVRGLSNDYHEESESRSRSSRPANFYERIGNISRVNFEDSQRFYQGDGLPSNVSILNGPRGSKIYLVGTNHFSVPSRKDVSDTIRLVRPNVVMLELCNDRSYLLTADEESLRDEFGSIHTGEKLAILHQEGRVKGTLLLLMRSQYARWVRELGVAPGGEFRTAYGEMKKIRGSELHMGDRPNHITLARAFASLSLTQMVRLAYKLWTYAEPVTKEVVEWSKQREVLKKHSQWIEKEFPELGRVFITERDTILAWNLQLAALKAIDSLNRHHQKVENPLKNCNANSVSTVKRERQRSSKDSYRETTKYCHQESHPFKEYRENCENIASTSVPTVVGVVGIAHVEGIVGRFGSVTETGVEPLFVVPRQPLVPLVVCVSMDVAVDGVVTYFAWKLIANVWRLCLLRVLKLVITILVVYMWFILCSLFPYSILALSLHSVAFVLVVMAIIYCLLSLK